MSHKKVESKTQLKRDQVASYLEELAKSLRAGKLLIQCDEDYVYLAPTDVLDLELEASQKKNREKVSLELSWSLEPAVKPEPALQISSKEPKPAPVEAKPKAAPEAKPAAAAAHK